MQGRTIELPFAIGETVWRAAQSRSETWVTCPECLGSQVVTLTQGNGQSFTLECACCSRTYHQGGGTVRIWDHKHHPEQVTLRHFRECRDGEFIYDDWPDGQNGGQLLSSASMFATREECETHCAKLNRIAADHENESRARNMASRRQDLAWSVHYWQIKLKDCERDLETARERLNASKAKKKESESPK